MATGFKLVTVEKDGEHATHLSAPRPVSWTNGKTTVELLPACGTRVDATALMNYTGQAVEVTCGRCVKSPKLA